MSADAYLKARADFQGIKAELMAIVHTIRNVAKHLETDPMHFSFSNSSIGLPAAAKLLTRGGSADANKRPSSETIMKLLAKYHQAKYNMNTAWAAIAANHRSGLVAPDL